MKLEKGKRIVYEWTTTEWPAGYPPSLVELTFKPKGKKTEMTMIHSKAPAEQADDYAEGLMDWYWQPLKKYFAKSRDSVRERLSLERGAPSSRRSRPSQRMS